MKAGLMSVLAELGRVRIPKGSTRRTYEVSALDRIRAATDKRAAYEQALLDRPNASAATRRKWAKAAGVA